jgi:hypothetical protein
MRGLLTFAALSTAICAVLRTVSSPETRDRWPACTMETTLAQLSCYGN